MTLLPETPPDEPDDVRTRRLAPTKKLRRADHEAGDDGLSSALENIWSQASLWARAVRDHQKEAHGVVLTLEHCRDILARALARRPMSWVMVIRSRPSHLLIATLIENLESIDARMFIQPEPADHLAIWGSEENVNKALQVYGADACRRRWYRRLPASKREIDALYPQRKQSDWLPAGVIV